MALRYLMTFYWFMFFPFPAWGTVNTSGDALGLVQVGSFFQERLVSCLKKRQLEKVLNPKTPFKAAHKLFAAPGVCDVTDIAGFVLTVEGKFTDPDGKLYYLVGVGNDKDRQVQFYSAFPAERFKKAP